MMLLQLQANDAKSALSQLLLGGESSAENPDAFAEMLARVTAQLKEGGNGKSAGMPLVLLQDASEEATLPISEMLLEKGSKNPKIAELLQLLKTADSATETATTIDAETATDIELLDPLLMRGMTEKELRELIRDAKGYLKSQISSLSQPEEMPNTLRGLVKLAEKIGIDVSKITLEEVRQKAAENALTPKSDTAPKTTAETATAERKTAAPQERTASESKPSALTTEELVRSKQNDTTERKSPTARTTAKEEGETPLKRLLREEPAAKPAAASAQAEEARPDTEEVTAKTAAPAKERREAQPNRPETTVRAAEQAASEPLRTAAPARQESRTAAETAATTAKAAVPTAAQGESKTGGGALGQQGHASAAATTATAETDAAIAQAKQPLFGEALNRLLRGDSAPAEAAATGDGDTQTAELPVTESKTATVATTAAAKEEMQLKIAEAKETVRHFASDIKEAVQNYKPPFTRIKIQLNPVKLGEVDVTMIQRGNNLHINISSNTAAVTTLAQNASELRTQLSQNGMGNATMNFSSNANAEQQQQQQRQHMAELYEAYENSDNFEVFEQLELTIPQYV